MLRTQPVRPDHYRIAAGYCAAGHGPLGYRPTVVASATATRDLPVPGGTPVPAARLQTATLAGIADLFAVVAGTPDDVPADRVVDGARAGRRAGSGTGDDRGDCPRIP